MWLIQLNDHMHINANSNPPINQYILFRDIDISIMHRSSEYYLATLKILSYCCHRGSSCPNSTVVTIDDKRSALLPPLVHPPSTMIALL